jgi:S-formylglutathione hydrolase FrmB
MQDPPIAGSADPTVTGPVPTQRKPADQTSDQPAAGQRPRRSGRRRAVAVTVALAVALVVLSAIAALVTVARAGTLDRVPLLNPTVAVTVEVLAGLALVGSWISRRRRWLTRWLPAVVLSAAAVTGAAAATLRLTGTVTDAYPVAFALWVGMGLAAVFGAPLVIARRGVLRRLAAGVAVPLTLGGALLLVNDEYGVWPTLGDLLGHTNVLGASALHLPPSAVKSGHGVVVALDPPATVSQFGHRPGSVYLPPAYFTPARGKLPVIIMLAGAPGGTVQWPTAGKAIATADAYAATHHGRAPIMVFVDQNGSATGDTECVDGPRGNAETYLTVDVRNFVTKTLRVQQTANRSAIVGFSEGGTCAIDLALAHPALYHHFVDLAGDDRPTLGNPQHTLTALFGGSQTSMDSHDPGRLLATHHYKGMTAWFAAGVDDHRHLAGSRKLAVEASRAGLKVHEFTGVAGHNWQFASAAFSQVLPTLCTDLGLK